MAKIFLDANIVIDLVEKRKEVDRKTLFEHLLFISPLSIHIVCYLYKYKIPDEKLFSLEKILTFIPLDTVINQNSLRGPTNDFEDNVQLHSCASAQCDIFLTEDKRLYDIKFFGKTKISSGADFIKI